VNLRLKRKFTLAPFSREGNAWQFECRGKRQSNCHPPCLIDVGTDLARLIS